MAEQHFMDEEDLKALWSKILEIAVPKTSIDQVGFSLVVNQTGNGTEWKNIQGGGSGGTVTGETHSSVILNLLPSFVKVDAYPSNPVSNTVYIVQHGEDYDMYEKTPKEEVVTDTVFGNIDLANRHPIKWDDITINENKEALQSWFSDEEINAMKGSESTVLGAWDEFDGVKIAYSPMLQTDTSAKLIKKDTMSEYIWGLVDKCNAAHSNDEGWSTEELLSYDRSGLEFDGVLIQNMVASVGAQSESLSEEMHTISEKIEEDKKHPGIMYRAYSSIDLSQYSKFDANVLYLSLLRWGGKQEE